MTEPTSTPASATAGLAAEITMVEAALAEARRQAEDGAAIDLSGLEGRVAALCVTAQSLPVGAARVLLGPLDDLVATLAPLADALTAQHALCAEAIAAALDGRNDPHTARHRASAAYGRGPGGTSSPSAPLSLSTPLSLSDEPT